MKHDHQIIPTYDASEDVSEWWAEVTGDNQNVIMALYETTEGVDSHPVARGANGYGYREYDVVTHYFIGLTIEDSDDIRFIDLDGFMALGEQHGFDASALIGTWQDAMDWSANN